MVVLITASPVFPSKNNFVKALRKVHPEITTVVQNVNGRDTSMVLGEKEHVLYGPGFIVDVLCGKEIPDLLKSFYQINPVQTEKLYNLAIEAAGLTGKETVVDAYCGIGTIGIVAASAAKEVIGVELNKDAVRDAVTNAKANGEKNIRFYNNDAGKFMVQMPPRTLMPTWYLWIRREAEDRRIYGCCSDLESGPRGLCVLQSRDAGERSGVF